MVTALIAIVVIAFVILNFRLILITIAALCIIGLMAVPAHAMGVWTWGISDGHNSVELQESAPQCAWKPFVIYYVVGKSGATCDFKVRDGYLNFKTDAGQAVRVKMSKMTPRFQG
jgi:hypothetical protein